MRLVKIHKSQQELLIPDSTTEATFGTIGPTALNPSNKFTAADVDRLASSKLECMLTW